MFVDALCSLLTHDSKSNMPFLHPWYYMFFKHVHFWKHSGMGEGGAVVAHEGFNVVVYKSRMCTCIHCISPTPILLTKFNYVVICDSFTIINGMTVTEEPENI